MSIRFFVIAALAATLLISLKISGDSYAANGLPDGCRITISGDMVCDGQSEINNNTNTLNDEDTPQQPTGAERQTDAVIIDDSCNPKSHSPSSVKSSNGMVTVKTSGNHGYKTGDKIEVEGASNNAFNGAFTITVIDTKTFTYGVGSGPDGDVAGSVKVKKEPGQGCNEQLSNDDKIKELEEQLKALEEASKRLQDALNEIQGSPDEVQNMKDAIAKEMAKQQQQGGLGDIMKALQGGGTPQQQLQNLAKQLGLGQQLRDMQPTNMGGTMYPASPGTNKVDADVNAERKLCVNGIGGNYNGTFKLSDQAVMDQLTKIFKDKKTGATKPVDPDLIALLSEMQKELEACYPGQNICFNLHSGFRDPHRAAKGAGALPGAGKGSQHLHGTAADIFVPGVPAAKLFETAWCFQAGGVGWYGHNGHVHVDTAGVRTWGGKPTNFTCGTCQKPDSDKLGTAINGDTPK